MLKYNRIIREKFPQLFCILTIIVILLASQKANTQISAETTKWKNDATAAYTLCHDDLCDYSTQGLAQYADPIAYERGIVWAGGAILLSCEEENFWDKLQTIYSHGHEIECHSWNHTDISGGWDMDKEIVQSKTTLEEHVPGLEVTFFIFPMDNYTTNALEYMRENGYLGARAGPQPYDDRGVITNFNNFDPLGGDILWDVYGPSQSIYQSSDCLAKHVDAAINAGGWSIQEMHGISDESWEMCPVDEYTSHLDYVKSKMDEGDIWNGTPTEVIKYIMTYNNCGDPDVTNNVLSFSSPDDVPDRYDTEITVLLTFDSDPGQIKATQGSTELEVEKISTTEFYVQVNPTLGDVDLELGTKTVFTSLNTFTKSNVYYNRGIINARLPVGAYKIKLFRINGQKIGTVISGYSNGEVINTPVNITGLANGFYLLTIQYNGGTISNKIVLAK